MSLELINTGAEANDGTGDPPRQGALKINANFLALQTALDTKLEAEALTDLTASDAAQDSAIAALILNDEAQDTLITGLVNDAVGLSGEIATLSASTTAALATKLEAPAIADFEPTAALNARDTANRARANHTGTQPANTVSGLATVATSGAYSDLSGPPAIPYGFTYDQQAEPSAPAAGATWRERSAGGLIKGEWEWLGAVSEWVSLREHTINSSVLVGNTTTVTPISEALFRKRYVIDFQFEAFNVNGVIDASNFLVFMPLLRRFNNAAVDSLPSYTFNSSPMLVNTPINAVYEYSQLRFSRIPTGTPGSTWAVGHVLARYCRV
ncbi:hypothetical protein VB780_02020 [Leptolyngbya sp. CCNP1308]|uniref:hypothetical protein n=1 Tax=Leptolyngbya sp. CCNP1308 TaxID=3110255 RepID=UPI002B1EDF88|nr:hypothetical protein [Leptolyngbya sp. CCNP1308]MEA5447327.1 hypothetical protein [Leptolyngbya sp. CCNP1308]